MRISFARNSAGAPEITGTNNYYPFGLNHIGGGNISPFSNYHSYKFGGKELQETGMYDFGARMYMPDLGRWGVIDPLAEAMRRYSPYNYAFNNPISFIDPDGRKPRQFAMPTDARPDAPSGWINPNWLGRGDAAFGSIETGYSGGGAPMSAEGLLATAFNIGGTWNNTGFGLQNDTGTLLGYDGGYKSLNVNYGEGGIGDAVINIPEISLSGSSVFWGLQIQGHVNRYMAKWNAKSDFAWDRMKNSGRLNDHGVTFIGGVGDPAGIFDIAGQVMSTWKPQNRYLAMAAGIIGAVALKKPGLVRTDVVNLTEETFSQALMKSAENLNGYSIYGTKGLVGDTFNRNIFLIEASNGKSLSGLRTLVTSMEEEAIRGGANKISIFGSSVINKGFLKPQIAERFGYSFEKVGHSVILQKTLK